MGVEYAHGLFVVDLAWRPAWAHVERVHAVMVRWGLAAGRPAFIEAGDFDAEPLDEAEVARALPPNLELDYGTVEGDAVARLVGPSRYGLPDRYIQKLSVVLGVDFKVLTADGCGIEVVTPPAGADGEELESELISGLLGSDIFPADWDATPPVTTAPGAFTGVWRSAVLLDCGKDLPEISDEPGSPLPAAGFRAELEDALGTRLVERGWIY